MHGLSNLALGLHVVYRGLFLDSLSIFAEGGVTDLRSDVELGRLDFQLGDLIDCCCYKGRTKYKVS